MVVLSLSVFVSVHEAQNLRIKSMGGIRYALQDSDNSLNLYDFCKNPAWMMNDEKQTWLKITPSYDRQWGDYKRLYDYQRGEMGGVSFSGLKPLGENGTFLGSASYTYEQRQNVYRSLKRNPYAGEAFFSADTTTGNFTYNGPRVGFSYSFELFPGLFAGTEANYQVLDGMKNIYSRAKTLYRDVDGKLGLAYEFPGNLVWGFSLGLFDSQESLEMKNTIGQTEVEIFNFRGETYSTWLRKETVNQKIRKQGRLGGTQLYYRPSENLEAALKADYILYDTKILLPRQSIKEFEEGFASFENYSFDFQTRYQPLRDMSFGASLGHAKDNSWSKNSERNLLLWKWNVNRTYLGVGTTFDIRSLDLLLGLDYEIELLKADSSKYIDVRFNKLSSTNNFLRIGAEYKLFQDTYLRAGYNLGKEQIDIVSGGSNVTISSASLGVEFKIFEETLIGFLMQYGNSSPRSYSDYSRDHFSAAATIRLNTF